MRIFYRSSKLKILVCSMVFSLSFLLPGLPAHAADIQNSLCTGTTGQITGSAGSQACNNIGNQNGKANDIVKTIVNILSVLVGFVAVVMLIIGGFRYITSGGSSDKVSGAKNTIIYALIGLVIVALAQIIVQFVLNKADCPNGRITSGANKGQCKP